MSVFTSALPPVVCDAKLYIISFFVVFVTSNISAKVWLPINLIYPKPVSVIVPNADNPLAITLDVCVIKVVIVVIAADSDVLVASIVCVTLPFILP